jgi:exodeoxyribonuclease-3
MKIITWNCQMAFRKKGHLMQLEKPDILIIPECENIEKLAKLNLNATSCFWYGKNKNKGIAVFSFGKYELSIMDNHNESIEIVIPIAVTRDNLSFTLLAVWAQQTNDYDYRHIGQVWTAIFHYKEILSNDKVIIAGDFNSNVIWDKNHRLASHSMAVEALSNLQIYSSYHNHFALLQGKEIHPTFYLYRHENKPYHIDYCFISDYFIKRLRSVTVGCYEDWKQYSDHSPLIVDFDDFKLK